MATGISHRASGSGEATGVLARWWRAMTGDRSGQRAQAQSPADDEDTSTWGVGGPAMRQPGSTGIERALKLPEDDPRD
jgi:hypothetical protein